ncbi:MAG: type II toxin-antitoxin system antitoxin, RelB/DinJ family [Desulfovibrio sp.]|nr:type II toxin-antitoxin system antitoxin, RelB/DinJ family [Desulfovibrio sp.]
MANLQVKLDDSLRDDAQLVASQPGIDLPSAVRIFLAQMMRQNGLPFKPTLDLFYCPANQKYLKNVIADIHNGAKLEQHELLEE